MRSIEAYIAHHEKEQLETVLCADGTPAVELHFTTKLPFEWAYRDDVLYCGYIDRVVRFQGVPYILDHKTTGQSISTEKGSASYFGAFTPDAQMTGYSWAAKEVWDFPVRGVIVDAMQVAKTKTEFARGIVNRTANQINEWAEGAVWHIELATNCAVESMEEAKPSDQAKHFPMNPKACHSRYGACTFAGICGRDPNVREAFLETEFEVKEWNPLAPRQSGLLAEDVGETVDGDV